MTYSDLKTKEKAVYDRIFQRQSVIMLNSLKDNEYECSVCHGVFEKGWSDEEARADEKERYGANDPDAAIVCDDCYKKMFKAPKNTIKIPDELRIIFEKARLDSMIYGGALVQMPFTGKWKKRVLWRISLSIRISLFFYRVKSFFNRIRGKA
jgi:hypothetical protein